MSELYNTGTDTTTEALTFDSLARALEAIRPKLLYYAVSEHAPQVDDDGVPVYFLLPESEYTPETFVCHPDNLERAMVVLLEFDRPLIDLKEYKPRMGEFLRRKG